MMLMFDEPQFRISTAHRQRTIVAQTGVGPNFSLEQSSAFLSQSYAHAILYDGAEFQNVSGSRRNKYRLSSVCHQTSTSNYCPDAIFEL